jgi:hypothetical protein
MRGVSDRGEAALSERPPDKQPETGIVILYHGCHKNECRTIRSGDLGMNQDSILRYSSGCASGPGDAWDTDFPTCSSRPSHAGTYSAWPGTSTGSLASRIGSREPDWARAADVPRKRELCRRKWRCPSSRGRVSLSSSSFPTVSHRSSRPGSPRSPSSAERVGIAADTTLQLERGRHERCTCGPYDRYEPGHDCTARGSCRTAILCVQKGPAKSERRHVGLRECPANIRSALSCHPKLKHQDQGSGAIL